MLALSTSGFDLGRIRRLVEGIDPRQALFPECLEDWINEENPVRVIDAFIEKVTYSGSSQKQ
jgi:hypothetical protein